MKKTYKLPCLDNLQMKYCDVILFDEEDDTVSIEFKLEDLFIHKESNTFFEALVDIRAELQPKNIKLLCQGCKKNVYPSGMLLSMGNCEKAYVLTLGKQARMTDLVNIFDDCNPTEYATIEEQKEFYNEWVISL